MEKISIARRRWEKHELPFSIKTNTNISLPKIDEHPPDSLNCPQYSLGSLFKEMVTVVKTGKKQFTMDIISGLEKPLKLIVSLESPDSNLVNKKSLSVEEAAQVLRIPKKNIYRHLKQGNLRGLKIGRKWQVFLSSPNISNGRKEEYQYVLPILGNAKGSL